MVHEGVYEKAKTDSNMAPVIDVTKLVSLKVLFRNYVLLTLKILI